MSWKARKIRLWTVQIVVLAIYGYFLAKIYEKLYNVHRMWKIWKRKGDNHVLESN